MLIVRYLRECTWRCDVISYLSQHSSKIAKFDFVLRNKPILRVWKWDCKEHSVKQSNRKSLVLRFDCVRWKERALSKQAPERLWTTTPALQLLSTQLMIYGRLTFYILQNKVFHADPMLWTLLQLFASSNWRALVLNDILFFLQKVLYLEKKCPKCSQKFICTSNCIPNSRYYIPIPCWERLIVMIWA